MKTKDKPAKTPPATPEPVTTPAPAEDPSAPFSTRENKRLLRVNRFLVRVAEPDLARVRARVAYGDADHEEGWRLYRVAAGEGAPLESTPAGRAERTNVGLLQHLDEFENKWFPRTKRIIERFTPAEHREGLAAAFFRDLQQQPLGPLVVGSVGTFLERVEALESSEAPGAKKVRAVLAERGLDAAQIKRLRAAVKEAESLKSAPLTPVRPGGPSEVQRARRAAYESLWLWWKDWRETFTTEVNGRQRRELGLVDTSLGSTSGDKDDADDETPAKPAEKGSKPAEQGSKPA